MFSFVSQLLSRFTVGTATEDQPPTPPPYIPRSTFDMTQLSAAIEMTATSEANALSSPLLRLPAEIRALIFYHTLGGHDIRIVLECKPVTTTDGTWARIGHLRRTFDIRRPHDDSKLTSEEIKSFLNLTLVCRQIYAETGLLPFVANNFVITHTEEGEKWLAQKLMPAHQSTITAVQCKLEDLFFDFEGGSLASRYCTGTFRQLEGLECLVLDPGRFCLTEEKKKMVVEKVRKTNGNAKLKVRFL